MLPDQPGWSNCRIVSEREEYFFWPFHLFWRTANWEGNSLCSQTRQLCKIAVGGRRLGLRPARCGHVIPTIREGRPRLHPPPQRRNARRTFRPLRSAIDRAAPNFDLLLRHELNSGQKRGIYT